MQDISRTSKAKIAAFLLFIHGFIEIIGFIGLILAPPSELIAGPLAATPPIFLSALSLLGGGFRIFVGYGVWRVRKWGLALGMIFSTSTIITAPLFLPYGIMDMLIAILVLTILVVIWLGE